MPNFKSSMITALCSVSLLYMLHAGNKPPLTLDDFFNSVSFSSVKISPDGRSVAIATMRADWERDIFRHDLWLYRDDARSGGLLVPLTLSGHDSAPQWSPDGRWIAFLSDRKNGDAKDSDSGDASDTSDTKDRDKNVQQLYLISVSGGEAFPVTKGDEPVHAFSWSPNSRALFFATRTPWNKAQKEAYKREWKDVIQFRDAERGDVISRIEVESALALRASAGTKPPSDPADTDTGHTPGSHAVARTPWRVQELVTSPDAQCLAFATTSISERQENTAEFEIYVVKLGVGDGERTPRQLTRNNAFEQNLRWAKDGRHIFFRVIQGSLEGNYRDTQDRLYQVDCENAEVQRWATDFGGAITDYEISVEGTVIAAARLGTEVQMYTQANHRMPLRILPGQPGSYELVATSWDVPRVAFVHSSLDHPAEVFLAEGVDRLKQARAITSFNKPLTEHELPKGKSFQWKADDGITVEGMLIYPPGRFESVKLPMLTLIHGGPADADGNHFKADWYQWSGLAASQGWLVFQPNYRGSSGYGDAFLAQIVPEIVSRPGKDILQGVDALVEGGIADPDRLAVAGYSYGGYMANWLITQTARFKAAMTGAGAVEHTANWGNDDMTVDDAYFLGGRPWEAPQRYQDEAAIFRMDKVRTPTHIVGGADDIRVAVLENYLLDRALHSLGIPSTLLIFPGEGHELDRNPWHGKIKVREELKWLEKYAGISAGSAVR